MKRLFGEDKSYLKLYQLDNGFQFASRKAVPVAAGNHKADAVVVVARDPQGRLLVIKELRPVVNSFIWAFPAGLVDEGENAFQAAGREVKEETGLNLMVKPQSFRYFENTFACPGMCDEKIVVVEGTVYGELSQEFQEKHENITPYLMDADDMQAAGFDKPGTRMQTWLAMYLLG